MIYLLYVSFAILTLIQGFSNYDDSEISTRIAGGHEASPHQFPYQVAIFAEIGNKTGFCGGSIISQEYILTAAHCLIRAGKVDVLLGAHNLRESHPDAHHYSAEKLILHEGYVATGRDDDIALIKLPEKIEFNDAIQPVRLPRYSDKEKRLYKKLAIISGWGRTSDRSDDISMVLRYVKSKIVSQFFCKLAYLGFPGKNQFCVSGRGGKSECSGDSGGPLVINEKDGKLTQYGIVSYGIVFGCQLGWPVVYTRVTSYLSWIHNNTGIPILE